MLKFSVIVGYLWTALCLLISGDFISQNVYSYACSVPTTQEDGLRTLTVNGDTIVKYSTFITIDSTLAGPDFFDKKRLRLDITKIINRKTGVDRTKAIHLVFERKKDIVFHYISGINNDISQVGDTLQCTKGNGEHMSLYMDNTYSTPMFKPLKVFTYRFRGKTGIEFIYH